MRTSLPTPAYTTCPPVLAAGCVAGAAVGWVADPVVGAGWAAVVLAAAAVGWTVAAIGVRAPIVGGADAAGWQAAPSINSVVSILRIGPHLERSVMPPC